MEVRKKFSSRDYIDTAAKTQLSPVASMQHW